jgi:hypothetical protein
LNVTWGGLPASVPIGYIQYFVLPAVVAVWLARRLIPRVRWRPPITLLVVGLVVGFAWALFFNGLIGARQGTFHYGRVIPGLAIFPGTKHQYPLYDSLAMGIQMMLFTYLLGRTDEQGRNFIEVWASDRSKSATGATLRTIASIVVIANVAYLSVYTPHIITKMLHLQTTAPKGQLYDGVQNQPL